MYIYIYNYMCIHMCLIIYFHVSIISYYAISRYCISYHIECGNIISYCIILYYNVIMQYVISYCIVVPSTVVHHIIYIYITSDACMHAWMDGWMYYMCNIILYSIIISYQWLTSASINHISSCHSILYLYYVLHYIIRS